MTDADPAKFYVNAKTDAPDSSGGSNINTPNIYVKIEIGKMCSVVIALSRHASLRRQALCDAQSAGDSADTGNFDATIDAKKEATKESTKEGTKDNTEQKDGAVSTSRHVSLRHKTLCETHNYGIGVGDDSGMGGMETKQKIRVGEGCGKYRMLSGRGK